MKSSYVEFAFEEWQESKTGLLLRYGMTKRADVAQVAFLQNKLKAEVQPFEAETAAKVALAFLVLSYSLMESER